MANCNGEHSPGQENPQEKDKPNGLKSNNMDSCSVAVDANKMPHLARDYDQVSDFPGVNLAEATPVGPIADYNQVGYCKFLRNKSTRLNDNIKANFGSASDCKLSGSMSDGYHRAELQAVAQTAIGLIPTVHDDHHADINMSESSEIAQHEFSTNHSIGSQPTCIPPPIVVSPSPAGTSTSINAQSQPEPDQAAYGYDNNFLRTGGGGTVTKYPYIVGEELMLRCSQRSYIDAKILQFHAYAPPVMTVKTHSNGTILQSTALLKLYDRRFGSFRETIYADLPDIHTQYSEASWEEYISSGLSDSLLKQIEREKAGEVPTLLNSDEEYKKDKWQMYGEREGRCHFASYAQFMEQFRAYTQLQPVQGICIPQLYGTVAYTFPSPYVNEPIKYFQAPGLLSEMIAGFCLSDLLLELPDADIMIWQDIIQRAVDCITEVNLHGVIIHDCTPKNMLVSMVEEQATKVLLVRFEHVSIESQYREECRKRQDSPASSNDCKCWDCLISAAGNPVTIGSAMVEKVKEVTGHDLKVTYRRRYDYMGVGWTIVDNRQPEGPDGLCEKISRGVATAGDWGRDTFLAVSRWFRAQKVKAAQSNNNDANTDDNGGQLAPGV